MNEQLAGKRYVRTTITNADGSITTARINLSTGEIKPYSYKDAYTDSIKARPKNPPVHIDYSAEGDILGYTPHWITTPPPSYVDRVKENKTIRKTKMNENNVYLDQYMHLNEAIEDHPALDDLFSGVTSLDCGNNKPLNKSLMFNMLRDLDEINSKTIQGYTGYTESYCSRLAQYLRVLSNAFDREVESN